ncbi:uncharacterized protein EKO05_0003839 [Ascochyta rabiei]|uniref:Uncharacterized protein n=1 Tax=Didymella rabiei TaxID=5454 RepID=A0A163C0W1_DIDRA|nr:uncharacterized protein EKO05_0003839 [Ascochyta rabiei]KZM22137.1 hypothetical protein ST47_g6724 [Ascochyta rabiei]UPX13323.1 hypothetical protein EKO05_0003839 [Ascochyta rabiei]
MLERPPPHSVQAIRAKRKGGKKVPKKYRKYHTAHTNKKEKGKKKSGGQMATRAFSALRRIIEHVVSSLP